jgi:hypothetical protein
MQDETKKWRATIQVLKDVRRKPETTRNKGKQSEIDGLIIVFYLHRKFLAMLAFFLLMQFP